MMHQNIDICLPIESCKLIINSKHVQIRSDGVEHIAKIVYANIKQTGNSKLNLFDWKNFDLNPKKMNEFAINWIFVTEALNFSCWHPSKLATAGQKYRVTYNGNIYSGFQAICAAINRGLDDGYPITEPNYFASITVEELKHLFRSDTMTEIPLLEERLNVLHETGAILLEEFQGTFLNCIKLANGSAVYLLKLIVDNFPSFRDESLYFGQKVSFYKKAQAVILNIHACFEGRGIGHFFDIDELTVCVDHQLPQILRYYNAISYSDDLTKCLISNKIFNTGDEYEVDIRAASLIACRLITENVRKLIKNDEITSSAPQLVPMVANGSSIIINDVILNYHLNNYRIDNQSEIDYFIPFHKVYCIFY